jgi:P-type conjugative transfer protein TrbG
MKAWGMVITAAGIVLCPAIASAQQQPVPPAPPAAANSSPEKRAPLPPLADPLSGPAAPLSAKEKRGVSFGRQWVRNPDMPARGEDGSIVFVFGSTLPTVVCAPLYVCDLALQTGETINDVNAGDSVRWKITPAAQGSGAEAVTHVIIKPTDVGLTTNLIITTSRRTYIVKLVSQHDAWMPRVSFEYPGESQGQWAAWRAVQERQREMAVALTGTDSTAPLDFGYRLSGDEPAWMPVRVYSNGKKTYIQFPSGIAAADLPALVTLADDGGWFSDATKQLVNYRFTGDRFEVDKVFDKAALISGTGSDQTTVEITRERRN